MRDIQTRKDLEIVLLFFYEKLLNNERINFIFIDVAKIDLTIHLPIITDFWEQSIFNTGSYRNNVMDIHQALHTKQKLTEEYFQIWLFEFYNAIDYHFQGSNAEKIKTRARSIATIMKLKLS